MVSIVPADESLYNKLSSENSAESVLCMVAKDGDRQIGSILYSINGEEVNIRSIKSQDDVITDGLVRAALNSARNKGAVTAVCSQESLYPVLVELGFKEKKTSDSIEFITDISLFFKDRCGK